MTWDDLDWSALERLRRGFLGESGPCGPYWMSPSDLASYDFTYGERIGWKWDAVIDEIRGRGWVPPRGIVMDWGCGSGIAGRRAIRAFGPERLDSLLVWDHSPLACDFAENAAREEFPQLRVASATPGFVASDEPIGLLLVSHVINELDSDALASLRALALRSAALIWVEPGTRDASRRLGQVRDALAGAFGIVAPCTHSKPCPVLLPGNENHWCHHFAAPPSGIFADSGWVRFGHRAGIDLRSLPYSFVALDRTWPPEAASGMSRVLGRPETFKPYVRLLNCDAEGLVELTVQKRDNPSLYKDLGRAKGPLVYRWHREGTRILAAEVPPAP